MDPQPIQDKLPGQQQLAALELLIQRLEDVKQRVERGSSFPANIRFKSAQSVLLDPSQLATALPGLTNALKTTQTKVNDSQKEFYNAVNRFSKVVDKVRWVPSPYSLVRFSCC